MAGFRADVPLGRDARSMTPGFWRRLYHWLVSDVARQRKVLPAPDVRGPGERMIEESGAGQADSDRRMIASVEKRW